MSKRADIRMNRRWSQSRRRGELSRAQMDSEFAAMNRQMCAASTFVDSLVGTALCLMAEGQRKKHRPNPKVLRSPLGGDKETK